MHIDFLLETFNRNRQQEAIVWKDNGYTYEWLLNQYRNWKKKIEAENIRSGTVVVLEADFSPNSIALFLALIQCSCIIVPLTSSVEAKKQEFIEIAQGNVTFAFDQNDILEIKYLKHKSDHPLYQQLFDAQQPGLVLFSSGSTGKSKAVVHNLIGILKKFKVPRHSLRVIPFLLYDHIGGVNTMLYTLSNGGCMVTIDERTPDTVLYAIEKYKVELLPTSPTFLNMLLLSKAYQRHSLESLKAVTYGTEPMPENTLNKFNQLFPKIKLLQTYGLSELGILRSKSKNSKSLWVKVGGEGFKTRIVDDILHIKAQSQMLGYLNAPSPFTKDGWFNTQDSVQVRGEYIKILGRQSDIINVGGEKVYPQEVENTIQQVKNVAEVIVYGENNPITGKIVCAKVRLLENEEKNIFVRRLKKYCSSKLENYKVPVRVKIVNKKQYGERFKKIRY